MKINESEVMGPPAPRPCSSCPYRRDVPSGIWDASEYEKLRAFDLDTAYQPRGLFQCHQADPGSGQERICAGWAGCHGPELMGLRWALVLGRISDETYAAAVTYTSPVPLFASGNEAADHGLAGLERPSPAAVAAGAKIQRVRRPPLRPNRSTGDQEMKPSVDGSHDQLPQYTVLIDRTSVGEGMVEPRIRYDLERAEDDLAVLRQTEIYPLTLSWREDETQPWKPVKRVKR